MVVERLSPSARVPPVRPVAPVPPAVWPVGPRAPAEVWPAIAPPRELEGLVGGTFCLGQGLDELRAYLFGSLKGRVARGRGNRGRPRRGHHSAGDYKATRTHLKEGKEPRLQLRSRGGIVHRGLSLS